MLNLRGLTTGIGSMPHVEVDSALDLIFKYCPEIPFWPQLPQKDKREGMLAQFSENLPCLEFSRGVLSYNPADKDRQLEKFYERLIAEDLDYFKISPDFASGLYAFYQKLERSNLSKIEFIKAQITGPFTFAGGINDETGRSLLHNDIFRQAILKGLVMKGRWQRDLLRKFNKKIILFFDEPYLSAFGSAYTPLNREDVIGGLEEFSEGLKAPDVLLGVHCCGNTDWSIFTEINHLNIISFDAFSFLDKFLLYAQDLNKFLKAGGIICWGIVPTLLFTGAETPDILAKKIKEAIKELTKKGIPLELLEENLLLSPACGLGSIPLKNARKIFSLLSQISTLLKIL
ncbi:MAG: methionine synthase [Candidatus Omnitrophica bacterium]|nr:methionine synthase [Candidatus Omnitrophota bacterium]